MYLYGRRAGASIAASIWLLIFRVAGACCVVDGISKLGLLPPTPNLADFQPSPLGPLSPVLEIVFGLLVFVGCGTRIAALVLMAHLGLGELVVWLYNRPAFPTENWDVNVLLLTLLIVFGPGAFSVDHFSPNLLNQLLRRPLVPQDED